MKKLLYNEFLKIIKRPFIHIFCVLLIISTVLLTIYVDYEIPNYDYIEIDKEKDDKNSLIQYKELESIVKFNKLKESYIDKHEFNTNDNIRSKSNITYTIFLFSSIFIIVLSSNIVAKEYENKTIKLLLLLNYKKWKILFSKFLILFFISIFISFIIYLTNLITTSFIYNANLFDIKSLYLINERIKEKSYLFEYTCEYFKMLPTLIFLITSSFFISLVFKSSSFSVAFNSILISSSSIITSLLVNLKMPFIDLTFIPYLDLTIFLDKINILYYNLENSINLSYSKGIIILLISSFILYFITNFIFQKRELK